jgi:hypothetical protein
VAVRRVPEFVHAESRPSSRYAYWFFDGAVKSSAANSKVNTDCRYDSTIADVSEMSRVSGDPDAPMSTGLLNSSNPVTRMGGARRFGDSAAGFMRVNPLLPPK